MFEDFTEGAASRQHRVGSSKLNLHPNSHLGSLPRGVKEFEKPFLPDIHKTQKISTTQSDANVEERTRSTVIARKNISLGSKKPNYDF